MPDQRPRFMERALWLAVFVFIIPAFVLALLGLLVYPTIFEVVRSGFR